MHRYSVQRCDESGKNVGDPQEVMAESALDAAERVTGLRLRIRGKLGEMRARVRLVGGSPRPPIPFYAA